MCFSAPASFVAGSALLAVGALTIKKAKRKEEIPLALVPLLFGIQQLIEGLVWLSFGFDITWLNVSATLAYSLFAYIFWPVYIPFVVRSLETVRWRKKILSLFQFIGITLGVYLLYFHLQEPVTSQVIHKSIVYSSSHFYPFWAIVFYVTVTCISAFFSSHKLINVLGVLGFILAIVSYQFYAVSFVSVWCFFAAVLSTLIYGYFKKTSASFW